MKALVTGGAGFIGSHIVDLLLKEQYEVSIIDNLSTGKLKNINKQAKFYNIDICNKDSVFKVFELEKPDFVVHEASQISVESSIKDPANDAYINIIGTINILEACRKYFVRKIIYPASAAIFGEPQYLPIDEKHPLNMISPYGITKHTVEHYLKVYYELYGIKYTVIRYSNVYGPRQSSSGEGGVVSIFCEKMLNGENPIIYGDGKQVRDFVFVEDVSYANLLCLENDVVGTFNVSSNTEVSINDLVDIINTFLVEKVEPIFYEERLGDIKKSRMSYDKIKNTLGWLPKITIDEGIKRTLEYFKILK